MTACIIHRECIETFVSDPPPPSDTPEYLARLVPVERTCDASVDVIEETLRLTNPLLHFRRTAAVDVELGGARISAGDKLVLWYPSANVDENVFDRPFEFDLRREPNQHLAFGIGTHFCLGARLARLQMRIMLKELLTRCPAIEVARPARRIHSNFLSGALELPVVLS